MDQQTAQGLAIVGIAGGIGLLIVGLAGQGDPNGLPPLRPLPAGVELGNPQINPDVVSSFPLHVGTNVPFVLQIHSPFVQYRGPVWGTFTFARLMQGRITVAGSGIAAVNVGPGLHVPTQYDLVSPTQLQPEGDHAADLRIYPWPGPPGCGTTPTAPGCINGAPPALGYADLVLEIYGNAAQTGDPNEGNGLGSVTYTHRIPYARTIYPNAVQFVG